MPSSEGHHWHPAGKPHWRFFGVHLVVFLLQTLRNDALRRKACLPWSQTPGEFALEVCVQSLDPARHRALWLLESSDCDLCGGCSHHPRRLSLMQNRQVEFVHSLKVHLEIVSGCGSILVSLAHSLCCGPARLPLAKHAPAVLVGDHHQQLVYHLQEEFEVHSQRWVLQLRSRLDLCCLLVFCHLQRLLEVCGHQQHWLVEFCFPYSCQPQDALKLESSVRSHHVRLEHRPSPLQ